MRSSSAPACSADAMRSIKSSSSPSTQSASLSSAKTSANRPAMSLRLGGGGRKRAWSRSTISPQKPGWEATPVSQNSEVGSFVADDRADGAREAIRPVGVPRQHLEQVAQPYVGGIAARRGVGLIGASIQDRRPGGRRAGASSPARRARRCGPRARRRGWPRPGWRRAASSHCVTRATCAICGTGKKPWMSLEGRQVAGLGLRGLAGASARAAPTVRAAWPPHRRRRLRRSRARFSKPSPSP